MCQRHASWVWALSPIALWAAGCLDGSLNTTSVAESPFRANDPRFNGSSLTANMRQVDALASFAQSRSMTVAQLALAWLLAQGNDVVPIPGTRNAQRAQENAAAMRYHLEAKDLAALESVVPANGWVGDRQSFAVPVTTRPSL